LIFGEISPYIIYNIPDGGCGYDAIKFGFIFFMCSSKRCDATPLLSLVINLFVLLNDTECVENHDITLLINIMFTPMVFHLYHQTLILSNPCPYLHLDIGFSLPLGF
jgi:hypothetical protein